MDAPGLDLSLFNCLIPQFKRKHIRPNKLTTINLGLSIFYLRHVV